MKITILGATGMTGKQVVRYALGKGHDLRLLVRDPSRVDVPDGVEIVKGDALDPDDLNKAVTGCSAVVSALGPTNRSWKTARTSLCTRVTGHILDIMARNTALTRYVMLSSASLAMPGDRRNINGLMTLVLGPLILGPILADKRSERQLLMASDANWTMVRAPEIVDGPGSGRAAFEDGTHSAMKVNSGDVAQVLVDQLDSNTNQRKGVFVSADLSARYGEIWGKAHERRADP